MLINKNEVLQCGDTEKQRRPKDTVLNYISIEDTYDAIKWAYLATGHGGRDRNAKGKKITIIAYAVKLLKSYCQECKKEKEVTSDERCCGTPDFIT